MEGKIFKAIADTMKDVGAVGKDSTNTTQGFKYRGIDAVMNALNPAMAKHGIFVAPEILEQTREERTNSKGTTLIYSICKIKYTFYADDGSNVSATVIGEGMDTGDKATNKAMSIAFKYACFQVFCIPTEEMSDPDAESHEVKPKAQQNAPKQTPPQNTNGSAPNQGPAPATPRQIQAIKNLAKKANDDYQNALERNGLTEPLTSAQASGLIKMFQKRIEANANAG